MSSIVSLECCNVAHLNVTSIPKHFDQLKVFMINKPVDILSINETRLDYTISNDEITRLMSGGGVAVYV